MAYFQRNLFDGNLFLNCYFLIMFSNLGHGSKEFLIIRACAVLMLIYTLYLGGFVLLADEVNFNQWSTFFDNTLNKIFTFLFVYGVRSLFNSFRGGRFLLAKGEVGSLREAVIICLILTWLNPHVYLDTVILLGIASTQYSDNTYFAAGAITASFIFFYSLGFGARLLSNFFEHPFSWKILDGIIGLVMWSIAFSLVYNS